MDPAVSEEKGLEDLWPKTDCFLFANWHTFYVVLQGIGRPGWHLYLKKPTPYLNEHANLTSVNKLERIFYATFSTMCSFPLLLLNTAMTLFHSDALGKLRFLGPYAEA